MQRKEVEKKYLWKIEDIFPSVEEWNKTYEEVKDSLDFSLYEGKLGDENEFVALNALQEKVGRKLEMLYLYAHMAYDTDTVDPDSQVLMSKAMGLIVAFNTGNAFVVPELTSLPEEKLLSFLKSPKLKDYDYQIRQIIKGKRHVLSKEAEEILSAGGEIYSQFQEIFGKIDNADLPLEEIDDGAGNEVRLSHGLYGVFMQSPDRSLRERVFKSYYNSFKKLINTITSVYAGSVKKDVYIAKAKKYDSSLTAALENEDVTKDVYDNLLQSVNEALPLLHRYVLDKKKALNLSEMHMYDMYTPLVEQADLKLEYDKAYDLVKEGLSVLGEDYVKLLDTAFKERWIDVCETENKRSGAYSTGVYDSHPYVLLNYQKSTHEVFTIAHEMGHSIHTYFSNKNQPYPKAEYKIFVAEVASTVNEVLLLKHILKNAEDKKLKKYLLSYFLEMIRTTLFRQTQFSEFEEYSHSVIENGGAITVEDLSAKYLELNKKYYGEGVVSDEEIAYEWARIPHFYTAFYVYKYATGIISAMAIAERILTEGKPAIDDYFAFLSSGGSDSPVELLKIAGVDLTKKDAFISAMKVFEDTLTEFEME